MTRAIALLLILPLVVMAQRKSEADNLFESHTFESGKETLKYRLLKPETIEEKKKYPLVIFLHGAGERGDDNKAQLKHGAGEFAKPEVRKKHPCFVLAPQCPKNDWWAGSFRGMSGASGKQVIQLVEKLRKELPIDEKRIYITGLSMGGFGTWELLIQHPDLFAAAIPICGGGNVKAADKLVKIPIWAFHGDADNVVKPDLSRSMIEAIKKTGGKPKYTEYPGVGHDSWTRTYRNPEVIDWLFEQKKD